MVRPDERRVATVLFADLVGFTTFSETADPEHVKNLVDTCFDRLAADVTAFGGRVDKIVGDALVALFGAPVAHEDDPERAVRAALAIQETMRSYCSENGVDVELRVGVNTGEVLVGGLRAGDDYTAMGDVVNTTSRLQEAAPPGRILVGPDTHAATADAIEYEPAVSLTVRGREQPIETWLAVGARTRPGRHTTRGDRPFVGRDLELAILGNAVRTAEERGRASLVLLVGEAGVGKSRLVDEVAASVSGTVLRGHSIPYGEANAWSPIGDALRHLLAVDIHEGCEGDVIDRVAELVGVDTGDDEARRIAAGLTWLMGFSDSIEVDPVRARDEATRSLQVLFESLAGDSTLLLVLSDLHWADDAMFELLDSLLARMRDLPFVVLVTARPELADRWNPSVRLETNVLQLGPLDSDATAGLVRSHVGPEAPERFVEALVERSGGNPFFVEELVAIASDAGGDSRSSDSDPGARIRALPATLRGLVTARLDVLDESTRSVLADCAVVGSTGAIALVEALGNARGASDDTAAAMTILARQGLLAVGDGEYRFRTDVVQEIAYGTLTKAVRAIRHVTVAEWSAGQADHESETEHLEHLAFHYGAAASLAVELGGVDDLPSDLLDRAVAAHERAATHSERLEIWHRAEEHLDAAIRLAGDEDGRHLERLVRALRARIQRHRLEGVESALTRAEELASASQDPDQIIATLLLRGLFEQRREHHADAIAAYDRAIARAGEIGDDRSVAEGLRGRGLALLFAGDHDAARTAFEDALGIFAAIGNRRGEAWALQNLAWIAFLTGEPMVADERLDAAVEMFTDLRDWGGLDWALGLRAWVRFNQGRLAEAEQLAHEIYGEGQESGDAWALGMMGVLLGQIALWRGRPGDALDLCDEVRERFSEIDDNYGVFQTRIPVPRALACLGRLDEAQGAIEALAEAAIPVAGGAQAVPAIVHASIGDHVGDADWCERPGPGDGNPVIAATGAEHRIASGILRLQSGDAHGAVEVLEREHAEAFTESAVASSGGVLAMARSAVGQAREALALTDRLLDLEVGSYLDRLQAWMGRAFAATRLGDTELATTAAARAVELADDTSSPLDHAITRLALAVVLEALEDPGAPTARTDAEAHLDRIDLKAPGWRRAFALAAAPS